MASGELARMDPGSAYAGILDRAVRALLLTQGAAASLADALASKTAVHLDAVDRAEAELDRIDREIDTTVASAVAESSPRQARELLTAMKIVIDLERIGDLLASVAACARALKQRLDTEDAGELIRMTAILERMLADAYDAFEERNLERAISVLRMDSDIDRHRNLLLIRHLEQGPAHTPHESVHVLFMAQALERAGDHVKNVAEEICHLVSGRTLRHLLQSETKPGEQMCLEPLGRQPLGDEPGLVVGS